MKNENYSPSLANMVYGLNELSLSVVNPGQDPGQFVQPSGRAGLFGGRTLP